MDKIKIAIVDDHKMFRDGIKFLISTIDNMEIVLEASNGKEIIDLLETNIPDLILMDINMPQMSGIEATEIINNKYPEVNIICLSMLGDQEYYHSMINAGAKGFVLKESGSNELNEAINKVYNGENFFSHKLMADIIKNLDKQQNNIIQPKKDTEIDLTKREIEILECICEGLDNNGIAEKLFISVKTVEGHKTNLLRKVDTKNSSGLIIYAIKNKIIEI